MAKAKPQPMVRRWRFPWKAGTGILMAVGAIAAVVMIGIITAAMIQHNERFNLPLSAIDYGPTPAWIDEDSFRKEVRYIGDLPEKFHSSKPADTDRVKAAFAKHPWVASVDGGYTTVALKYNLGVFFREPLLRVQVGATTRTVDEHGVLLPAGRTDDQLAELIGERPEPRTPIGTVWDDATVKRAAELAKQFQAKTIEKAATGWRITERTGRVLVVAW